ncbi:MAG: hypothetical protein ACP5NS_04730 [Candidatus Pacearchaeota archaeon]
MLNLNNKGVAEVVQILLITVLSIVAIATVSSYVIKLSSLEQLSPAVDCLTMQSDIPRACVDSSGTVKLLVNSVESDLDLKLGLKDRLFECSTNSEKCSTCTLEEGSKEIFLSGITGVQQGDTINYQFNGCLAQEKQIIACVEP